MGEYAFILRVVKYLNVRADPIHVLRHQHLFNLEVHLEFSTQLLSSQHRYSPISSSLRLPRLPPLRPCV